MSQIEDLEKRIEDLEWEVTGRGKAAMNRAAEYGHPGGILMDIYDYDKLRPQTNPQLSFPLGVQNQRIISDLITYPITVLLKGTEAQSTANFGQFFTADETVYLSSVSEVHSSASTAATAISLQVEKLTGSASLGSGTSVLVSAFDLRGTADVVQWGTLRGDESTMISSGNRLALSLSGTELIPLKDVLVTIDLRYV